MDFEWFSGTEKEYWVRLRKTEFFNIKVSYKQNMIAHACNSSIEEVDECGSWALGKPELHSKFHRNLGDTAKPRILKMPC